MKKILLFLLLSIVAYGQTSTGQEQSFPYGILNESSQNITNPNTLVTQGADGTYGKASVNNIPISIPVQDSLNKKLNLPTGFLQGLQLSINVDPTKFNIAAGYYVVTDFSNLNQPVVKIISYAGATGLTPAYLATANSTYVALDINGAVVSSASPFTDAQRRTLALVGNVVHPNHTTINNTNEIKAPIVAIGNQLHDFMKAIGFLNENGNIYSANGANLMLNKSSGDIFGMGINSADYLNPHKLTIPAQTAITFAYRFQNGVQTADTQNINPNIYDVGGVSTAVPVGSRWTVQRINLFQSGIARIQPGQTVYTSFNDAVVSLPTQAFVTEQNIADNAVFRCYLIVQQGTTNLTSAVAGGTAQFVPVDKFGNIIGNGSVALTYSNIVAALGFMPENVANKQNSLAIDGTGTKYPTVDAINSALPKSYSQIVYVNSTNPNTATIFDTANPPITNNNGLKVDTDNLYIGTDASTWVYDGIVFNYVTKSLPAISNFYLGGSTADAGNDKVQSIKRNGTIESTGFIKTGGLVSQALLANGGILTNPVNGTGTTNYIPKFTASGTVGNSLIFDNGTNVGIGTTSPSFRFHSILNSDSPQVLGAFENSSTGTSAESRFRLACGTAAAQFQQFSNNHASNANTFRISSPALGQTDFFTNGVSRLYIANNGNILMGTTTDDGTNKLQVNGSTKTTALTLTTAPTTSAGAYDILTRNTSTGVVEKVLSNTIATVASPSFTGTPTAPTATVGTNTTQIATTAFVQANTNANAVLLTGNQTKTGVLTFSNTGSLVNGIVVNTNSSGSVNDYGAHFNNTGTSGSAMFVSTSNGGFGQFVGASKGVGVFIDVTGSLGQAVGLKIQSNASTGNLFEFPNGRIDNLGNLEVFKLISTNTIRLKNYIVATLPIGVQGDTAYVTDALAPTYLSIIVGGGAVVTPVFYNGTNWIAH